MNELLVSKLPGTHVDKGHILESVLATVSILPNAGGYPTALEFRGWWCPKCCKYFMLGDTYDHFKSLGFICCKVVEESELNSKKGGSGLYDKLAAESVLHMYGYTVSRQARLSERERRTIISFVIENRFQSTQDAVLLLEWLISAREGDARMSAAVKKWKSDLAFVRNYHEPTRMVRMDRIYARV